MHAVVPAAGRGTRLGSLTDDRPKPLVEVTGRPLLAHVLDALAAIEPARYVVVTGYRGEQIRSHFGDSYHEIPITYVTQPEPVGLADAIRRASAEISKNDAISTEEFVVCNGDNALRDDLSRLCDSDAAATLLVERVTPEQARTTGVVVTDEHGQVERVVEKPDDPPSRLVSAGAFRFTPAIADACRAIDPASTGEYELADAITHLVETGHRVDTVELAGERVNVNEPVDLKRATAILSENVCD